MGIKIPAYTEIEITAGGGVKNISPSDGGNFYLITGTSTLIADWTIQYDPTYSLSEQEGMEATFKWKANVDLNGNALTVLGTSLTDEMVSKQGIFTFEYTGASWVMKWKPDHEETDFITTQLKPDTTNGTSITRTADGARLTNDENTPDERDIYAYLSASKGWKSAGAILDEYDSGWKDVPNYDSGTGFGIWKPTTNHPSPLKVRFIGRDVYFKGRLLLPLDNGAGAAYTDFQDTVYTGYQRTSINLTDSGLFSGFSSEDFPIRFAKMVSSDVINPDEQQVFWPMDGFRLVTHTGNSSGKVLRLNVACGILMRTDGRLTVTSLLDREHADGLGTGGAITGAGDTWLSHDKWRSIAAVVSNGDDVYDLNATDSFQIDPSTVPTEGITYPLDFDGTDPREWGGVQISLDNFHYTIKKASSLEDIKTVWEAL